jgi:hypothetical protein
MTEVPNESLHAIFFTAVRCITNEKSRMVVGPTGIELRHCVTN